jgi:hypothetical protein
MPDRPVRSPFARDRALGALVVLGSFLASVSQAQSFDAATRTVTVAPSGGDDTPAVQAALDACVAFGPGCTVQLEEGTFRTRQLVAYDFHGAFRGAGREATVIEPFGVFPVNDNENVVGRPPTPENPWPTHVAFVGGDVTVSDLTLRMTGAAPAEPWTIRDMTFDVMAHSLVITGDAADARIERVAFEGGEGSFQGYNLIQGVYIQGSLPEAEGDGMRPLRGTFVVRDGTFRSMGWGSPLSNLEDSLVLIAGNRYENVSTALDTLDLSGTTVEIRGNTVEGAGIGFDFIQGVFGTPERDSRVIVHDNDLRGIGGLGVGVSGAEGSAPVRALVANNRIGLTGDAVGVGGRGAEDGHVVENVLTGEGRAGVALGEAPEAGAPAEPVTGWTVAGNDLSSLAASQAGVVLGPGSDGLTVVCDASEAVQNDGSGNRVVCPE